MKTEQNFIQSVEIKKVRHLTDLTIHISDTERKHLLLTGMNGSGKSSVLNMIGKYLKPSNNSPSQIQSIRITQSQTYQTNVSYQDLLNLLGGFVMFKSWKDNLITLHYKFPRNLVVTKSTGVKDTVKPQVSDFEKFLAKKRTEQAFLSFEKGNSKKVKAITDWFEHLESSLQYLFEDSSLELKSKRTEDKVEFYLTSDKRDNFDFNTLSDGYSSILYILFEIIMKMDNDVSMDYDKQGIALIDEIESHLHISLQKKILPFLTNFFPNMQFIVATHSPFVLQSEPNAVIYDLEKKERYEDFSHYSSENILETYFEQDKFSQALKTEMTEYEKMLSDAKIIKVQKEKVLKMRESFSKIEDIEVSFWQKKVELQHSKNLKSIL